MSSFRGFAIVTVIHDSEAELGGLLDSVARWLDPRPRVIVVDSGSSDGGASLARVLGGEVVELAEVDFADVDARAEDGRDAVMRSFDACRPEEVAHGVNRRARRTETERFADRVG